LSDDRVEITPATEKPALVNALITVTMAAAHQTRPLASSCSSAVRRSDGLTPQEYASLVHADRLKSRKRSVRN
jgi:hypothetical protein